MKKKTRKIGTALLTVCLILCVSAVPALAEDMSRSFLFSVTANSSHEINVKRGDIITVEFILKRTDSNEDYTMWGMQNEMRYDASLLELVEGSGMEASGVEVTDIAVENNCREYYMSYVSLSGGTNWKAETTVGTFKLCVLAETGTTDITCRDCEVSTADGNDSFPVSCENLRINIGPAAGEVGADALIEETSQRTLCYCAGGIILVLFFIVLIVVTKKSVIFYPENGEREIHIRVRKGKTAVAPKPPQKSGCRFTGWYRSPDGTEKWDFACDTVEEKIKLYAGWENR